MTGPRGIALGTSGTGVEITDRHGGQVVLDWPDAVLVARTVLEHRRAAEQLADEPAFCGHIRDDAGPLWTCTQPVDHDGPHIARDVFGRREFARWDRT